jgi:plasmid replication initiation protein
VRKDLYPNLDFFVADIWSWSLKDDQASMEHPMFSLSKSPDFEIRHYEHDGNSVTVAPSVYGHPTIWDKDILIYCCSQLIAGMREGREPQQVIRLTARDFLVSTNRAINNLGYDRLQMALNRLAGVLINTDIRTGGRRTREGFGIIDWWRIVERSPVDMRMVGIEIKLSDWLYRAVLSHEVLTPSTGTISALTAAWSGVCTNCVASTAAIRRRGLSGWSSCTKRAGRGRRCAISASPSGSSHNRTTCLSTALNSQPTSSPFTAAPTRAV